MNVILGLGQCAPTEVRLRICEENFPNLNECESNAVSSLLDTYYRITKFIVYFILMMKID